MVVWKEGGVSSPLSYGIGLSYYSRYIPETKIDCVHLLIFQTWTATSVDVEWVFSQGRIVLSHLCSCLSGQSTWALMCLRVWHRLGFVSNSDIKAVVILPGFQLMQKKKLWLMDGMLFSYLVTSYMYFPFIFVKPVLGFWTCETLRTLTHTLLKHVPAPRVRVDMGMGMGSPGKPQGYLRQSLVVVAALESKPKFINPQCIALYN